jgi:hypothetical protein
MLKLAPLTLLTLLACLLPGRAQVASLPGSLEVVGRVKIGTKLEKLERKRFYLFRGGLEANKTLVERLRADTPVSRDCFYCRQKASPEFMAWLKAKNCESPYCREIIAEDVKKVTEFQTAYRKGLKQFPRKPGLAQKWITTNLPAALRDGFYREQKKTLARLLGDVRPLQSVMTDRGNVKAIFIDIPADPGTKKTATFLVSNILPIEVGDKSYVWACEVEIGTTGKLATLSLKPSKTCEVFIRPLPVCNAGSCESK